MQLEQELKEFTSFWERAKEIVIKKGNDYASDDRLSNFKLVAQICHLQPEQVAMVMIATKAVRLGELIGAGKEASNESVADSLLDNSNYSFLLHCLGVEREESKVRIEKGKSKQSPRTNDDHVIVYTDTIGNRYEYILKMAQGMTSGYIEPTEDGIKAPGVDELAAIKARLISPTPKIVWIDANGKKYTAEELLKTGLAVPCKNQFETDRLSEVLKKLSTTSPKSHGINREAWVGRTVPEGKRICTCQEQAKCKDAYIVCTCPE